MTKKELLPSGEAPLEGGMLWLAALMLAMGNFIAVLNMTVTNVAVPTIAGNLGITSSQGTWVITSYAVAEAITVPLTGWLAARFGSVRVFVSSMVLFGLCSALCGFSNSLGMLVLARVLQGLSGGPLMPLSQTLLLRIFPKEKAAAATALWAMTTLVAPVVGPIAGGVMCDVMSWSWVFYINVPIALACGWFAWNLLKRYELALIQAPIDKIGLILLVIWVAALQVMLDEGKDADWFASTEICVLGVVAAIGFFAFLIWEWTEEHPVVDLRVFRHRGYVMSLLTLVLAFGAFFGINVLTPLWLQAFMGYTATWAGDGHGVEWGARHPLRPDRRRHVGKDGCPHPGVLGRGLAGRDHLLASIRHHGHGLLGRCHSHAHHGDRHAAVLRAAHHAGVGQCGRARNGVGRWPDELPANRGGRLRHLAGYQPAGKTASS